MLKELKRFDSAENRKKKTVMLMKVERFDSAKDRNKEIVTVLKMKTVVNCQ